MPSQSRGKQWIACHLAECIGHKRGWATPSSCSFLAWLGLRPVVLVARAQHALGSNLSDLEMHATSAESTGSCVCGTHYPSLAGSRCSPREQQQQQHRQHRRSRVHSNEANIIKPQAHVVFGESCKRISHSLAPSLVSPSLSLSLVV